MQQQYVLNLTKHNLLDQYHLQYLFPFVVELLVVKQSKKLADDSI